MFPLVVSPAAEPEGENKKESEFQFLIINADDIHLIEEIPNTHGMKEWDYFIPAYTNALIYPSILLMSHILRNVLA